MVIGDIRETHVLIRKMLALQIAAEQRSPVPMIVRYARIHGATD
jgi:hypothetical protein